MLPACACACDRECGFQRDGPALSAVWHQGRNQNNCLHLLFKTGPLFCFLLHYLVTFSLFRHIPCLFSDIVSNIPVCRHLWRTIHPSVGVLQLVASGQWGWPDRARGTLTHQASPFCPHLLLIVERVTSSAGKLQDLWFRHGHVLLTLSLTCNLAKSDTSLDLLHYRLVCYLTRTPKYYSHFMFMQLDKGCCVSSNVSIVHTDHNGMNKYCFMKCAYTCSNLLRKKELLLLNLKPRQPNLFYQKLLLLLCSLLFSLFPETLRILCLLLCLCSLG